MKKIAHYAPNLWAKGGIATYVRRLGEAQTAAGYEVLYLSQNPSDTSIKESTIVVQNEAALFSKTRALQCDVLHLHKPVQNLPKDRVLTVRTMHGNQGSCPTGTRYLVQSEQPCKRRYSVAGCFISHFTERCGSLQPAKIKRNFNGIKNELKLGAQIHTFTVSHFIKNWMIRTGFSEEKLHVIKSPAPELKTHIENPSKEGIPRFAFIGRLVPEKGAQWLLQALKHVKTEVRVDIVGDGPLRSELEAFSTREGLESRVAFHGWLDQAAVHDLIARSRAVVFPSIWEEPAGLITLEAAASGRGIIASRAGGIPEYAQDEFTLLVAPNNELQLAEAIEKLALDYELASRMGACALRNAKTRYALSTFLEKQISLYELAFQSSIQELSVTKSN